MKKKVLSLKLNQGFEIKTEEKTEKFIVTAARSQCRTTHKRKDC